MSQILIVEDNAMNMKLARDILTAKGHGVLEATSGEEGLQMASAERPDLVLMDIQLPGINGIDALGRLRADPRTAQIPVVAFTASVTVSDRSRVAEAGFDAFVSKPIDLKEFIAVIAGLLEPEAS